MTHNEFFAALKQGNIARVYLFEGEEAHIKARALQALRAHILPEGLEALSETVLQNPTAGDVIAACETLPMMTDLRLVLVRECALITSGKAANEADESAKLAAYIANVPETTCLVFYQSAAVDRRKKLSQALAKGATVVKFDPLNDAELHKWITAQLRRDGKTIGPGEVSLLAFTAGRELLTLSQEIEKLTGFVGAREAITRADIEEVVTPSLECTVFQLVDALVAGKEAEAFERLAVMLENGEARIGILAMLARQYRNLLHLKLMEADRVPEAEAVKRLGVPPFALRRLQAQARKETAERLREKLDLCVDTDYAIKSGKMREDAALERAMMRLCSA